MSDSEDEIPLYKRAAQAGITYAAAKTAPVPVKEETPDPAYARTNPVIEDDDSDDEMPLASRQSSRPSKRGVKEESDDDNVPLSKKRKQAPKPKAKVKKESAKVKKVKSEVMDVDMAELNERSKRPSPLSNEEHSKPQSKRGKTVTKPSGKEAKDKKKAKEEEEIYKWWEEESVQRDEEDGEAVAKWSTLEHSGVLFPPDYVPHGVKMKYNGKLITLSPEAEEVASFFAALLETDHAKNPTFQKNFFRDWQDILKKDPKNPKITDFGKCDFRPIWEKFEADKEQKKQMTKEEKARIKQEKTKIEEPFIYAYVDGRKEKVGNFRIEPPGLFRGRGDHPKTGTLKQRVQPEQVTINLGHNAKVPSPPPGHKWAAVVHDRTATWLATWKENVNNSFKYVFLSATSAWKGQSDMQKFEKARELKKYVDKIRARYTVELKDKECEVRQRATAMYLIDRLALRAGNEKGDEEADTVGCCSLRYEHVELESPNTLHFDFLGKDSIRYQNSVPVDEQVFKNIKLFKKQVGPGYPIFDRLTTVGLNKHLNSCMKGLSAKVFRTYNASHTFQQQLDKLTVAGDLLADKMLSYNRANREVAVLCNHQRAAPKSHAQQMLKIQDKIRALKYQRMKFRKQIFEIDPSIKKKKPELAQDETDMNEEWIIQHEADLVAKERERVKSKFEKQNEKLKAEGEPTRPASELEEKLKAVDEMEERLKTERKTGHVIPKASMTVEKLIANVDKMDQRINATKIQATDKEENKEIALGTSKMNYIDPRISVAWSEQHGVPLEKVFSKTLIEKFRWAQQIEDDWKF
ncbi:DNA topoisomerase 1 [Apophysomyces sp. BC1034]|nr:DNA topoisomerase 1 [Apophysomyces sp. BC1015]KAG0171907.1 DNA topoisomerase 1 [Apophysomyces sp. BC1021]KAG0184987.1 DNA topoisomerase 1 [Apophysomyces sp. BC1034]